MSVIPQGLEHRVLEILNREGASTPSDLLAAVQVFFPRTTPHRLETVAIVSLHDKGYINTKGFGYRLTKAGVSELESVNIAVSLECRLIVKSRLYVPTGPYCGAEMTQRSNRPGAYDAYTKPSLFNGVRT